MITNDHTNNQESTVFLCDLSEEALRENESTIALQSRHGRFDTPEVEKLIIEVELRAVHRQYATNATAVELFQLAQLAEYHQTPHRSQTVDEFSWYFSQLSYQHRKTWIALLTAVVCFMLTNKLLGASFGLGALGLLVMLSTVAFIYGAKTVVVIGLAAVQRKLPWQQRFLLYVAAIVLAYEIALVATHFADL